MVKHLHAKIEKILGISQNLNENDLIIDIGSNDSTTLQAYPKNYKLVGIDPTGIKFKKYYPEHIDLIADFFTKENAQNFFGDMKAKVITSFSMFYDLPSPLEFMSDIYNVLDDEGIWVFEQSYMPTMLEKNSYDTICHEHLEYYCLHDIYYMTEKVGFKIVDVEFNDVNGGSFSIIVSKKCSKHYSENENLVKDILKHEKALGVHTLTPYKEFQKRVEESKSNLISFLEDSKKNGKKVCGLGASTKGNVILQYCNITEDLMPFVGEVNEEKFGSFTPGTKLPIISETEVLNMEPDYLLILPWHFKEFFTLNKKFKSFNKVFILPNLEIIR